MQVTGTDIRMTMSASSLIGDHVMNRQGEDLGKLEEIMLDLNKGCVAYGVLSFGGVLGMGSKLFAVPWQAMSLDEDGHNFVWDVSKDRLQNAPGFDKDNWPDMSQPEFGRQINQYYGYDFDQDTGTYSGSSGYGSSGTRGGYGGGMSGY